MRLKTDDVRPEIYNVSNTRFVPDLPDQKFKKKKKKKIGRTLILDR